MKGCLELWIRKSSCFFPIDSAVRCIGLYLSYVSPLLLQFLTQFGWFFFFFPLFLTRGSRRMQMKMAASVLATTLSPQKIQITTLLLKPRRCFRQQHRPRPFLAQLTALHAALPPRRSFFFFLGRSGISLRRVRIRIVALLPLRERMAHYRGGARLMTERILLIEVKGRKVDR